MLRFRGRRRLISYTNKGAAMSTEGERERARRMGDGRWKMRQGPARRGKWAPLFSRSLVRSFFLFFFFMFPFLFPTRFKMPPAARLAPSIPSPSIQLPFSPPLHPLVVMSSLSFFSSLLPFFFFFLARLPLAGRQPACRLRLLGESHRLLPPTYSNPPHLPPSGLGPSPVFRS